MRRNVVAQMGHIIRVDIYSDVALWVWGLCRFATSGEIFKAIGRDCCEVSTYHYIG